MIGCKRHFLNGLLSELPHLNCPGITLTVMFGLRYREEFMISVSIYLFILGANIKYSEEKELMQQSYFSKFTHVSIVILKQGVNPEALLGKCWVGFLIRDQ